MGENIEEDSNAILRVLMLPWLAHGSLFPFLELAKRFLNENILVHFCSTPINIGFIKEELNKKTFPYIKLVEIHLPELPDLPSHLHTTRYLPPHLLPTLKTAFDSAEPSFRDLLGRLQPDLLVYDFLMPWAPRAARELHIPSVLFLTTAASSTAFFCHNLMVADHQEEFPFAAPSPKPVLSRVIAKGVSDGERFLQCISLSSDLIAIRTSKEIESDRIDYLASLIGKVVMPVGQLIPDAMDEDHPSSRKVIEWLNNKDRSSVLFASFGSEYSMPEEETEEIAKGLELSKVSFIWVIRFPKGGEEEESVTQGAKQVPCGFLERIEDVGLVLTGWAPQREILTHPSTGGFLSHCAWSSVMEGMRFGVPLVALPKKFDQPINAKLVVELGMGVEVNRGVTGKFKREDVARGIRDVIVNEEGHGLRVKAKKMAEMMGRKGNEEVGKLVRKMALLCTRTIERKLVL